MNQMLLVTLTLLGIFFVIILLISLSFVLYSNGLGNYLYNTLDESEEHYIKQ